MHYIVAHRCGSAFADSEEEPPIRGFFGWLTTFWCGEIAGRRTWRGLIVRRLGFIIERPPFVVGEMETHSLFRYVEIRLEIFFYDIERRHAWKFSRERVRAHGAGQAVGLG